MDDIERIQQNADLGHYVGDAQEDIKILLEHIKELNEQLNEANNDLSYWSNR